LLRGRREALAAILRLKFRAEGTALLPAFLTIDDADQLAPLLEAIEKADTVEEVRKLLPAQPEGAPASQ
jgi:hypothetical protein